MSKDGHLAWDCGESYREVGGGTCCSQGVPSGFMILYLQSWLVRRFIYTFNQIFPGCKFPPRGKWNTFRDTISLRGHQGTIHCFAAAIYQMVPWWLREWVRICERASFTSRDALSESPRSAWTAKGGDGGREALAALLFPSHSHAGLLCQWKTSQGKLVKDRTQLLSTCLCHLVRATSLGTFPGMGCPGSQMSRAFSRPHFQEDGPRFCPVLSLSLHQHIT